MAAYATVDQVEAGYRALTDAERTQCEALLNEAGVIIDAYNSEASDEIKEVVSCRMVRRAIGTGFDGIPIGATQGSMSALGYSQSWQASSGTTGELYLSKIDKKLLGVSNSIGSYSPVEELVQDGD